MTLMQEWLYLKHTRNSFYILFPAKGIASHSEIISNLLYVRLKGNLLLASYPSTFEYR